MLVEPCLDPARRSHEFRDALGALRDAGRRHRASSDGRHGRFVGREVLGVFLAMRSHMTLFVVAGGDRLVHIVTTPGRPARDANP